MHGPAVPYKFRNTPLPTLRTAKNIKYTPHSSGKSKSSSTENDLSNPEARNLKKALVQTNVENPFKRNISCFQEHWFVTYKGVGTIPWERDS
ncbi:hypothetical protein BOTNAR_0051g00020 [Botryotinia narcissicola]|uniref:Uncharacterized protein n=1 Tax=Botryotinia narcissicola TaxID=278944 RepID=A0A4Z1JCL0_9HELO|nr:hypothetical protein BOTNAR_0051g00020 [Botryotinia narcissicola]